MRSRNSASFAVPIYAQRDTTSVSWGYFILTVVCACVLAAGFFLAAKQHFEQQNGAGSVKGAYGRWGGGDNLDTFNTRYGISTGKGLPHDEAMIEAARKTKTGEWARAAGFNNVKITKAEGSPGAYTNVEVEFTK